MSVALLKRITLDAEEEEALRYICRKSGIYHQV